MKKTYSLNKDQLVSVECVASDDETLPRTLFLVTYQIFSCRLLFSPPVRVAQSPKCFHGRCLGDKASTQTRYLKPIMVEEMQKKKKKKIRCGSLIRKIRGTKFWGFKS